MISINFHDMFLSSEILTNVSHLLELGANPNSDSFKKKKYLPKKLDRSKKQKLLVNFRSVNSIKQKHSEEMQLCIAHGKDWKRPKKKYW